MLESPKILVIDDDPGARRILAKYLQSDGYEVYLAENGMEGLEIALSVHPHLVLCDWMMPYMDGLQLCKYLKSHPLLKDIYFIFLTAIDKSHLGQGIDNGADDFITKPINYDEVAPKVRAGWRIVQNQLQLLTLTIRDYLTGAFNRSYFDKALGFAVEHANNTRKAFVLALLDLDDFKYINDELGHLVGDNVLQKTSRIIEKNLTGAAILARVGGDEFVCLLSCDTIEAASVFLVEMEGKVRDYFAQHNPDWPVGFSFGCARFDPENPVSAEELYQEADRQMYERKKKKKAAVA